MLEVRRSACAFTRRKMPRALAFSVCAMASGFLTADPTRAVGVHSTILSYAQSAGNGISQNPAISQDGSIVAFHSRSNNLVPGETNLYGDILVLDKISNSFEIACRASGVNGAVGNYPSYYPDLSLDARYVAFMSEASNLVPQQSLRQNQIYVRDRQTNLTELVSISDANQAPANSGVLMMPPRISGNGCRIVFTSNATNLITPWPYTGPSYQHVFLRDRCKGRTILVSRPTLGTNSTDNSGAPVISRDGRFVAFISRDRHLPIDDNIGDDDVFVYDVEADELIQRLDFNSMPSGIVTGSLDIDGVGEKLIGLTYLGKVPGDTNNDTDAYVVDIRSGEFEIASSNSDGSIAPLGGVTSVSISMNGEHVAFSTYRNLTGELPAGAKGQTWIRDLPSGEIHLISRDWRTSMGGTHFPAGNGRISPSGESAAFLTHENLDPRDLSSVIAQLYEGYSTGYSFQVLDPNPGLIDAGAVTTELDRLKVYGSPATGIAADGVTRLLLRFHTSQSGPVRFAVSDDVHTHSEFVGSLSSIGGSENQTDHLDVTVDAFPSGENYAFAILKAPEGFDRPGYAEDAVSLTRTFYVSVTELSSGASMELMLSMIRPPVALVHGIWSSRDTWKYALLQSSTLDTFAHDYRPTTAASFRTNQYEAILAAWDALTNLHSRGYAATQVDYIGHSMGGILGRQWVSKDYCNAECNRRSDNFFEGDFNKLITLGTPHKGSELTNVLWQIWENRSHADLLLPRFNASRCIDCGAVEDLRPSSDAILALGEATVPAHAIVGTGGQENPFLPIQALLFIYTGRSIDQVFGEGLEHDSVVKRSSQEGGLLGVNTTVIGPSPTTTATHLTETTELEFESRIESLLKIPATAEEFAQSGFPASDGGLEFSDHRGALALREATLSPESLCMETCLQLEVVGGGPVFHPGAEVTLEATGLEGYKPEKVSFLFGDEDLLIDAPPFIATFTIPISALGTIKVGAAAKGQDSWPAESRYQFDFLEEDIEVEQEAVLQGLRLEPPTIKSSPAFAGRTLRVFGVFSDNIERELTGYPISFRSSDEPVASVSSSGYVEFRQPGITSIVASYEGLQGHAFVEVSTPPIALRVSEVNTQFATVIVDKLNPSQGFRIFGTRNLTAGHTTVDECKRLELGLRDPRVVATIEPQGGETTYMEVEVLMPRGGPAFALQVVTDDCAISPVVVAQP